MGLIVIVLASAAVLTAAYFTYGRLLVRLFRLDQRPTPAEQFRDDLDYQPIPAHTLFPQHFSAIAAAGPIVGPILAGLMFGWLPALIWIIVGSIFIGGVHDFASLVASIRHKAQSIAEVVRDHMSPLSYLLFLSFIWIALVYIIVAFTDITASSFVSLPTAEAGGVGGGAVATSSLLYLILPIVMGLLIRFGKLPLGPLTVVFIVLVGLAIWVGKYIPLDVASMVSVNDPQLKQTVALRLEQAQPELKENLRAVIVEAAVAKGETLTPAELDVAIEEEIDQRAQRQIDETRARKIWDVLLLVYCLVAGVVPVWLLLQPRGHLGGYFLYFALGAGALGLIFGGLNVQYPAFKGFFPTDANGNTLMLFPILFITVACGACSGFHSLIASGTTSKQLRTEGDAKSVGYGAMLLEGMVAIVSLCCVMMFVEGAPELTKKSPNEIYAAGIGKFLEVVRVDKAFGVAFALMAFTTFVYDTLDVCTRLGRYIIQELLRMPNWFGRMLGTSLTAGVPMYFLLAHRADAAQPVWMTFWALFGASNQLLAALTLIGITVWLWKTRRAMWVWPVVGLPAVWMYAMSTWALVNMSFAGLVKDGRFVLVSFFANPVPYVGIVLLALAGVMLVEAIRVLLSAQPPPLKPPEEPSREPELATLTP
jgi:carbon starvation protein